MENIKIFFENVYNEIQADKNKKVVLIAGASSSGKSFCSQNLKAFLESKGIKTKVISADDYYKGISKTIVEKAIINNNFNRELNTSLITAVVRKEIENSAFPDKFAEENVIKITKNLEKIYGENTAQVLIQKIKEEFERINFDEPFAINFTSLANDINELLKSNGSINAKEYPFSTGEPKTSESKIFAKDYDIFIVEGLYTLRSELLKNLDSQNLIKCGVNCDIKSLLARRLNRDIKEGRGSLTPEQTFMSFIKQVLPNYKIYIQPTLSQAQFILETAITKNEIEKTAKSKQVKFQITKEQYDEIKNMGLPLLYANKETDYYFNENSSIPASGVQVRLRGVDGKATKLSFRSRQGMGPVLDRNIDEYDLSKILSPENKSLELIKQGLTSSGFILSNTVQKYREIYKNKDVDFKLDFVDGVGYFVEFDLSLNINTMNLIRSKNLHKISYDSYLDIVKKQATKKSEIELKFLINRLPEECTNPTKIIQTYFNPQKHNDYLCKVFNLDSLAEIESARIREENDGEQILLTLKSKGTIKRKEYEVKVSQNIANFVLQNNVVSRIEKNRYKVFQDGYCFEFDEYLNEHKGLTTVEIELNDNNITMQRTKIEKILKNKFELKLKDVTYDLAYKNNNLASKEIDERTI